MAQNIASICTFESMWEKSFGSNQTGVPMENMAEEVAIACLTGTCTRTKMNKQNSAPQESTLVHKASNLATECHISIPHPWRISFFVNVHWTFKAATTCRWAYHILRNTNRMELDGISDASAFWLMNNATPQCYHSRLPGTSSFHCYNAASLVSFTFCPTLSARCFRNEIIIM